MTRSRVREGKVELRIGLFHGEGLLLRGPKYFPAALALMDGTKTISEILSALRHARHTPTQASLESFCAGLAKKGLLEDRWDSSAGQRLGSERAARYRKHLLFYGLSVDEEHAVKMQERLAGMQVVLIGMGGIGSALAYHLAAAGVGRLRGVDPDHVELSNLTRQVLYRTCDLGRPKVDAARERLAEYNSEVRFEPVARRMEGPKDLMDVVEGCSLAVLSADTPSTIARWMNEVSLTTYIPFLITGYYGRMAVCGPLIVPRQTSCLGCVGSPVDDLPSAGSEVDLINKRFSVPSFGPINHLSAALAAGEALKYLTGYHEPAVLGARVIFDPFTMQTRRVEVRRDPRCKACA